MKQFSFNDLGDLLALATIVSIMGVATLVALHFLLLS